MTTRITVAGSAVALHGRAVWIKGQSGAGKSQLVLDLISRGCTLVADDRLFIDATPEGPVVSAPEAISGVIEARGIGLLTTDMVAGPTPLNWVVDLDEKPDGRLPRWNHVELHGKCVPYIAGQGLTGLAAVLMLLLSERAVLMDPDQAE
jgi:HPr kinase/phosphorylase